MMKNKGIWIVISLLALVGLLIAGIGCGTSTQNQTGGQTSEGVPPKVAPSPEGPWDSRGYYPVSLEGKKVEIIQLLAAHPVEMNIKQGEIDENQKYGMSLKWYDSNVDTTLSNQLVDAAISRGADLIVYSGLDPASAGPPVLRAQEAGIPVVAYMNLANVHADIGVFADSVEEGQVSTEILAKALNYQGKVAVVMGDKVTVSGLGRTKGFHNVCDKYPGLKIVADVDAPAGPWTRQGAYEAMKGVLTANPDLNGVFIGDDEMALGGILAIEEAGKTGRVLVTSVGGELSGLQAIKKGTMLGTAMYSPYEMGKMIVDAAAILLSSPNYKPGYLEGIYWADVVGVTIDNVDEICKTGSLPEPPLG
jgi:ABC-type sugar transport system substrate-binding protein